MIHVYPRNDLKEHLLKGTTCDCRTRVITDYAHIIVVHNSYDSREAVEIFNEILGQPTVLADKSKGWDLKIEADANIGTGQDDKGLLQ